MSRSQMAFDDFMVRVFNGRGAVSLRDHTVTGLQAIQFTPFDQRDWRFNVALREKTTGCVIDDAVADVWDYHLRTAQGQHPLGLNCGAEAGGLGYEPGVRRGPRVLVLQDCRWQPNQIVRKGTFHKLIEGKWISFAVTSVAQADAHDDLVHMELTLYNRTNAVLEMDLLVKQSVANPTDANPGSNDVASHPDARRVVMASRQLPFGTHEREERFQAAVVADLPALVDGWCLTVPPHGTAVAHLGIYFLSVDAEPPAPVFSGLADSASRAAAATRARLAAARSALPQVRTLVPELDQFYDRCLLSLLEARWDRADWPLRPFYAAGTWLFTLAWDVSFSSAAIALLDPAGLRKALRAYLGAGLLKHSYIGWDGTLGHSYAYTVFAGLWALRDYLEVTGDLAFLDERDSTGTSVLSQVHSTVEELRRTYTADDGLLDFGDKTVAYLETRTDGYQHRVAVANLMLVDALAWLAEVADVTGEDGNDFRSASQDLKALVDAQLWDPAAQWYANRFPDGSRHLVWSYHLFDALRGRALNPDQQCALVSHIREGVFLGPHGMYSVARTDTVHFDLDDADWGGGGQYTGMPLRVAESLWRLNEPVMAWDLMVRCVTWGSAFPYVPQEVYTDRLACPDIEQAVEVSAGAGVQAVIFGLFGIHPQLDGSLRIGPARQPQFFGASLTHYRHRGRIYDVHLGPDGFSVSCDDQAPVTVYYEYGAVCSLGDVVPSAGKCGGRLTGGL